MVIEEHARLEILLPNEQNWWYISENDIIQNSLSIAEKCMDDGSFMLGGVFSAQLSVKLRISGENVNSYTVIGAKIKVYSWYGSDQSNEKLRGVFWITSATRNNDIFTVSASDSLIWLDSASYGADSEESNPIYNMLSSFVANLCFVFEHMLLVVNEIIDDDKKLEFYYDSGIINNLPSGKGYCLLPPDMVGEISTRNPRDYASWLAEIACGFVFMDYSNGNPRIRIGQFGEEIKNEISWDEIELNSCEIADFTVQINGIWTKVYNGTHGSIGSLKGSVIDISDNPFKDGHWQYNNGNCMDILSNIGGKIWGDLPNCNGLFFRPFTLKCHCRKYFELGQKILLPDGNVSILTSIKWKFRGGTILGCAGKDNRLLSVSAKRSQAAKVKDLAYTKINRLQRQIDDINGKI